MTESDLESAPLPPSTTGLVWQDIKVSVPIKRSFLPKLGRKHDLPTTKPKEKLLLDRISGSIVSGEMMAIMGPSGAGKSTLLDVLSTRLTPSSGSINVLGSSATEVKKVSSYVEQSDSLLGVLTVRETIHYSASLSLPPSTPPSLISDRVDLIIADLGLSTVANQRIGTPIQRGISGGQKRRVSIGCSLVTLPSILFLDEPTSGLDTFTAKEVISAIKGLAKKHNIAVLATIHSPNWEIFSSFDKTLLLSKGRAIYQGPTGGVVDWFASLGWTCGERTNPADFMIELVNDDFLSTSDQEKRMDGQGSIRKGDTKAFADAWSHRPSTPLALVSSSSNSCSFHSENELASPSAISILYSRTSILTKRNFLNYSRNLLAYGIRLGMYLGMGILLATVWVNLSQTDTRINDRLSVHFFSVAFLGFMSVAGIPSFLEDRSVLLRESRNSLYTPLPFVLANTFSTLPLLFLCSLIFSVIAYWSIGLHPGASYFWRWLGMLYLGVVAAEFQALLISAVLPIFVAALAVSAFLNGFWMCVQGYFIRAVNLPRFWYYWAHWIDYETYAFDVLVKNDFKGLIFNCAGSVAEGNCNCSYPSSLIKEGICAVKGEDVLEALDLGGISTGLYAGILVVIVVVYRVLFWVVLRLQLK